MLTLELLQEFWRQGDAQVPGLIQKMAADAPTVFPRLGFNNDLTIAHAMAQFTVECGGGSEMTENINYTPERACQVWPNRFSSPADCLAKVGSFAGDPQFKIKLMNLVYGGRNGNTRPDDGSTYIGRGLSQVTGRGNYKALQDKVANGVDLVSNPDLVNVADNALIYGVTDLVLCECLPFVRATT
jgi:putative chitinase